NRQAPYAGSRVRGVDDPRPSLDARELGPAFIDDDGGRVCGTAVDADDQSITAHPMLLLREPARVGVSLMPPTINTMMDPSSENQSGSTSRGILSNCCAAQSAKSTTMAALMPRIASR